jgi:hypothetical protein
MHNREMLIRSAELIRFVQGAEMTEQPARPRKLQRSDYNLAASVTFPSGKQVGIRLESLSAQGLIARVEDWLPIGLDVLINIPGVGDVHAEIGWQMKGKFGGDFVVPLTSAQLLIAELLALDQIRDGP